MIGCTKLLCGTAAVSDALKFGRDSSKLPPHLLQFSSDQHPVVVWNITNRCNLRCKHCYISAEDRAYSDELNTSEAKRFIQDLAFMKIPVLLFSGGEPLIRKDVFELGQYAREKGIRAVLSTNGTLISEEVARRIKEAGFQYVGVSIDGTREVHDNFRCRQGAFEQALTGIKNYQSVGLKAGVRFTINRYNASDFSAILDLLVENKITRFFMYHLVYAGRGKKMAADDLTPGETREVIELLLRRTEEFHRSGIELEILTVDNHADGAYIYQKVLREQPERAQEVYHLLLMHGGCSAGRKLANVDAKGDVHACQFWGNVSLGNVRERSFSQIWSDSHNQLLRDLRDMKGMLRGRCGRCRYVEVCGGCRIRAEVIKGDMWDEDPACYLTDEEIEADPRIVSVPV